MWAFGWCNINNIACVTRPSGGYKPRFFSFHFVLSIFVEFPFAPVAFLAFLRATSVLWEFRANRGISFQRSLEFPFAFKQKSSCFCVSLLRWLARGFCWINVLQTCNLSPSHGLTSNERKNSNWICTIKNLKVRYILLRFTCHWPTCPSDRVGLFNHTGPSALAHLCQAENCVFSFLYF